MQAIWMRDWQSLLQSEEYAVGKVNPALFFNRQRNSRGAVHGDDFYVLANRVAINHNGQVPEGVKLALRQGQCEKKHSVELFLIVFDGSPVGAVFG